MAATYNAADPGATPKDTVRLKVGDTNVAKPMLQDEEILAILAEQSDVTLAAARAAEAIAGKFSRDVDFGWESVRTSASQRAKAFRDLAKDLRRQVGAQFRVL